MSEKSQRPSPSDLAVLRTQEQLLAFEAPFTSATALKLGGAIAKLSPWEGNGFSAAIVRDADDLVMFQWAASNQGPRNARFMDGKRAASRLAGRSSLRVWAEHQATGAWQLLFDTLDEDVAAGDYPSVLPVAGAFPLCERNESGELHRVATLTVSGLHEGLDHQIMVRALCDVLELGYGTDVPAYEGPAE